MESSSAAAAAPAPTYPVESLQRRLATGLGNKDGARGSLTRCAVRLSGLKRSLDAEDGPVKPATDNTKSDTSSKPQDSKEGPSSSSSTSANAPPKDATSATTPTPTVADAAQALTRELQLARIELKKLFWMAQRQQKELEQLKNEDDETHNNSEAATASTPITQERIDTERATVQQLRRELQRASSTSAAKNEYEQTAKLLCAQHPTSTAVLEQEIETLQTAVEQTRSDYRIAKAHVTWRQSQFRLLMQCMLDLKHSLNENQTLNSHQVEAILQSVGEKEEEDDDNPEKDQKSTKGAADRRNHEPLGVGKAGLSSGNTNSSAVVAMMEDNDDEDEEGALYDDL